MNRSGVVIVAVVFIGLFACALGAFIRHKVPAIFKSPTTQTQE